MSDGVFKKPLLPKRNFAQLLTEEPAEQDFFLDAADLEAFVKKFERTVGENASQRELYESDPEKFLESEAAVHAELQRLFTAAADPALLVQLAGQDAFLAALVALISHPNADVSSVAVKFVAEATDCEESDDAQTKAILAFSAALVKSGIIEVLLEVCLDWEWPAEAVDDERMMGMLESVENLLCSGVLAGEPRAALAEGWPVYLINVLRTPACPSATHHYAAELLCTLLGAISSARECAIDATGVELLVALLSDYCHADPDGSASTEFLENLVGILCVLLFEGRGQERFVECQGIEMCLLMIGAMRYARMIAVRILSFALLEPSGPSTCERFIEKHGLKYAFSLFMGKGDAQYRARYRSFSVEEDEERVCTIVASLFRFTPPGSVQHARLLSKFTENGAEKTARLVHIIARQSRRLAEAEAALAEYDLDDAERLRMVRMEAGLGCLQQCSVVAAYLLEAKEPAVDALLSTRETIEIVRSAVGEHVAEISDGASELAQEHCGRLQRILAQIN